tara:strand:+ start:14181 stop:18116 length:3936 start_codon:yes stop_codon:yes gene_type:complete
MNEYFNEDAITYGTPNAVDPAEEATLEELRQEREAKSQPEEEQGEQQGNPQQSNQQSPKGDTESKPREDGGKDDEYYGEIDPEEQTSLFDKGNDGGDWARGLSEAAVLPGVAALDFGVDAINLIPGVNFKKLNKFKDQNLQALRDLASIALPTVGLTALTGVGGKAVIAANAAKLQKLTRIGKIVNSPLTRWAGGVSAGAGSGVLVDYTSTRSQEHNALGVLKKTFPNSTEWIPSNLATLDSDSPEIKRNKTIYEGLGFGLTLDFAGSLIKLVHNGAKYSRSLRWVPEDEMGAKWKSKTIKDTTPDQDLTNAVKRREKDLDETGKLNLEEGQQAPVKGVHDLYTNEELGSRTVDDTGIYGAAVDYTRIKDNADTAWGRLGSMMSNPEIRKATKDAGVYTKTMQDLADKYRDAGQVGYRLLNGKLYNGKTIRANAEELAEVLGEVNLKELEYLLSEKLSTKIDLETGIRSLGDAGVQATKIARKKALEDLAAMGAPKALLRTSVAGQISDLAQGVRYAGDSDAAKSAMVQLADRVALLTIAAGKAGKDRGFALKMMDVFAPETAKMTRKQMDQMNLDAMDQLVREAGETRKTLLSIAQKDPNKLAEFALAYELTDGSVTTIDALNNYLRKSSELPFLSNPFWKDSSGVQNIPTRLFWANVYNSALSALVTPVKALASGTAMMVGRPVTVLAGALVTGDRETFHRGMYQLIGMGETMQQAFGYMKQTFKRSATDPYYVGVAGRESNVMANKKQFELLEIHAQNEADKGNFGPQVFMEQLNAYKDLAEHPWLRFGNRSMQAFDGFVQVVQGHWQMKGEAFDLVASGKVDEDAMLTVQKKLMESIWEEDELGRKIISDKATKYAAGEISLNLDTRATEAVSEIVNKMPILKPFVLFTKTPVNMIQYMQTYMPQFGINSITKRFVKDFEKFKPFEQMPIKEVEELLAARGITDFSDLKRSYNAVRSELKGRRAMGTLGVMAASSLFLNDSLTGNGVADRQVMQARREMGWKPRSIKLPSGNYVSYDNLGWVTDWLALTADIMDNFDTLPEKDMNSLLSLSGFILSASITDKTMLAGVEPLYDVLSGNPAAINRWASGFLLSAAGPASSFQAEIGRLVSPELKVVEENLAAMMMNRSVLKGALGNQYDWIDGTVVNAPGNVLARAWNTYSPWKVSGKRTPEKQFLIDIEFDMRPSVNTDGKGVKLTLPEKERMFYYMGKEKYFLKQIKRIMASTDGQEFRKAVRKAQNKTGLPINKKDWMNLHIELRKALSTAKADAIMQVDRELGGVIADRRYTQGNLKRQSRRGDIDAIIRMENK